LYFFLIKISDGRASLQARGDVLPDFTYFDTKKDDEVVKEYSMKHFGPLWKQNIPGEAPGVLEVAFPDAMRKELLRGYAAGVTFMDQELGKVLTTLELCGLKESTIVIFFSDHGTFPCFDLSS